MRRKNLKDIEIIDILQYIVKFELTNIISIFNEDFLLKSPFKFDFYTIRDSIRCPEVKNSA